LWSPRPQRFVNRENVHGNTQKHEQYDDPEPPLAMEASAFGSMRVVLVVLLVLSMMMMMFGHAFALKVGEEFEVKLIFWNRVEGEMAKNQATQ
jgi:hypothetical protein